MADINQPNFIRIVLVAILLHIINVIVMNVQYYYIFFVTQRKTRCDENIVINIPSDITVSDHSSRTQFERGNLAI